MRPNEFKELVKEAGFSKPDYTALGKFLGVSPQWARILCSKNDASSEHINKLEKRVQDKKYSPTLLKSTHFLREGEPVQYNVDGTVTSVEVAKKLRQRINERKAND